MIIVRQVRITKATLRPRPTQVESNDRGHSSFQVSSDRWLLARAYTNQGQAPAAKVDNHQPRVRQMPNSPRDVAGRAIH